MPYASPSTVVGFDREAAAAPDFREPIKVLIVESAHMIRGALAALLAREPDIAVVGELDRGAAVVSTAARLGSDIAVVDSDLPDVDGFEVAAQLHARLPNCRALILTAPGSPSALRRAVDVHAWGYLLKYAPAARLADTVRRISAGERVLDSDSAARAILSGHTPLTEREAVVLRLAAEGSPLPDIAARLFLSTGTVRNYLSSVIRKSGARNRIDAIRIARESGWI